MLVLFLEFAEFSSDVVSSELPENIPLPVISFNLYPEQGFLSIEKKKKKATRRDGITLIPCKRKTTKKMIGCT